MGGASVAAPLDSLGATFWNPATTSALPNSVDLGVELVNVQTALSSRYPANVLGPGLPPVPLAGTTKGDNGIVPLPSLGILYRPDDSTLTYGIGVFAVAGFGVNYPASALVPLSNANPILTAQTPNGFGLGSLYSNLQVIQIAPTVSLQVTDRLSIGGGPTVNLALLQADPLLIAPVDSNHSYPPGTHSHITWGAGFQLGTFYKLDEGWQLGASFKSPQWFDTFKFNSVDNLGNPRQASFRADLPLIASIGVCYTGFDHWLLAADFRFNDFGDAAGLGTSGFDASGAVRGLGFRSTFVMAAGAQYQLSEAASLRLGYTYNQDPIPDNQSSFNVVSPTIVEHVVYVGASYNISSALKLSLGYAHAFQNAIEGPLVIPAGALAGTSIRSTVAADTFMAGVSVHY
jgi:long-chain fatty acid transport protein